MQWMLRNPLLWEHLWHDLMEPDAFSGSGKATFLEAHVAISPLSAIGHIAGLSRVV
jgi:hypothetical protein